MKNNLSQVVKNVQVAMKKHSPEILTGIGIAGMITTTVMAVRATPKALTMIKEAERKKAELTDGPNEVSYEKLTPVETVKAAWTCYIPAAVVGVLSVTCLVGASSQNLRRNAALATAYTLSESALKEYQEKVLEEVGEKKERVIREAVAKDDIQKDPLNGREVIITKTGGDTLCYDELFGRYFYSDIDKLKKIENELNRKMRDEGYISLNEFYYEIGLNGVKSGEDLGWNIDRGYIDIFYSAQLADDERTPCIVLKYRVEPRWDFR